MSCFCYWHIIPTYHMMYDTSCEDLLILPHGDSFPCLHGKLWPELILFIGNSRSLIEYNFSHRSCSFNLAWVGNQESPLTWPDFILVQISACICECQFQLLQHTISIPSIPWPTHGRFLPAGCPSSDCFDWAHILGIQDTFSTFWGPAMHLQLAWWRFWLVCFWRSGGVESLSVFLLFLPTHNGGSQHPCTCSPLP